MVIESFLLSGVRGNSILSELNHFFYSFFAFGLTSIVTLQIFESFFAKALDICVQVCYNTCALRRVPVRIPIILRQQVPVKANASLPRSHSRGSPQQGVALCVLPRSASAGTGEGSFFAVPPLRRTRRYIPYGR